MLIPSTITARRTRRYTSAWYIHRTIHKLSLEPMDGGGRYTFQPPQISQSIRPRGPLYSRLLQSSLEVAMFAVRMGLLEFDGGRLGDAS